MARNKILLVDDEDGVRLTFRQAVGISHCGSLRGYASKGRSKGSRVGSAVRR